MKSAMNWAAVVLFAFCSMAWSSRAADRSGSGTFFFQATDARAGDVAAAVAEFYGVSVLIQGGAESQKVNGRLVADSLEEALEGLGFLVGSRYRTNPSKNAYFFGGTEAKVVMQFPSYGIPFSDLGPLFRETAVVIGDRIVVETDPTRAAQLRDVVASLADRPSLTLEVFLLDVSTNTTDRVNAWLESFRLGGGYVDQTAATANPVAAVAKGFVRDVDVRFLWQLLEKDNTAKVEFRQQAQILSGTSTKFTSGQIVEQPLIVREPQTGKDLVTQIDRRTIGLSLNLRATAFADGWHIEFDLSDNAISNTGERTTTFTGQRRIKDNDGFVLLTSFNRVVRDGARLEVPGFAKIPLVGKAFRKSTASTQNRSVMLLARPVLVARQVPKVGGP